MKIYHTETQADYDVLMEKLEAEGIETLPEERWKNYRCETAVFVHAIDKNHNSNRSDTTFSDVKWALYKYPDIPITKYKARVDDKMRFTKENVGKLFNDHDKYICFSINDLQDDILKLDDTPEKVAVPKYIADYLIKAQDEITLMRVFEIANAENELKKWKKEYDWIRKNSEKFAKAWIDGYTIEPEQLYYIPLPHLETSDGIQQVLSQRKGDKNYFASRPAETLQQRYTKEELAQVPEVYKFYATLIEGEEE